MGKSINTHHSKCKSTNIPSVEDSGLLGCDAVLPNYVVLMWGWNILLSTSRVKVDSNMLPHNAGNHSSSSNTVSHFRRPESYVHAFNAIKPSTCVPESTVVMDCIKYNLPKASYKIKLTASHFYAEVLPDKCK